MENLLKNISNYFLRGILILILTSCQNDLSIDCENCYAISNTNIIDVENGQINSNMTLIIKDSYIFEIGKIATFEISKEIPVIDGTDKYVIPGLWDMHAHSSIDTITRSVAFPLWIANGVTGIRNMKADCYDEEYPCEKWGEVNINVAKAWRKEISAGTLLGPRSILSSQYVDGPRSDSSTVLSPGTPEHGREHVKFLKKRGVDFIKVYEELPRDVYFAVADEANKQGMVFAGHVSYEVKMSEAIKAGQKSIEHCCEGNIMDECSRMEDELRKKWSDALENETFNLGEIILDMANTYDSEKCDRLFELMKEYGTWFTPTLTATESQYPYYYDWQTDERLKYIPKSERDLWREWVDGYNLYFGEWDEESQKIMRKRRFEIILAMHNKGIPLLAGPDSANQGVFWGSSIHEELELLVMAGLSEREALKTATLNPAIFLEATDSLGTVSKGKLADLILLDANPLDNINNTKKINGVVTNGRYFNKKALDSLLLNVEMNVKNNFN